MSASDLIDGPVGAASPVEPFRLLRPTGDGDDAARLDALAAALAKRGIRVFRVCNPLRSKLTLERVLLQLRCEEPLASAEHGWLLLRRLCTEQPTAVMVEQAETLDRETLAVLASCPGLHVVLVAGAGFVPSGVPVISLTPAEALTELEAIAVPPAEPAAPAPHPPISVEAAPASLPPSARPPIAAKRAGLRGAMRMVGFGSIGCAICAVLLLLLARQFYHGVPNELRDSDRTASLAGQPSAQPVPVLPEPIAAPPPAPAPPKPAPTQTPARATPPQAAVAVSGSPIALGPPVSVMAPAAPPASSSETPAPSPATDDPAAHGVRLVIHYAGSSTTGAADADRVAALLQGSVGTVETRSVDATPSKATLRYFRPEDRAAALELGNTLGRSGRAWEVRNFSSYRPSPSPGTIELWIPAG